MTSKLTFLSLFLLSVNLDTSSAICPVNCEKPPGRTASLINNGIQDNLSIRERATKLKIDLSASKVADHVVCQDPSHRDQDLKLMEQIEGSLTRAVKFYLARDDLVGDDVGGLVSLVRVDAFHGNHFEEEFGLKNMSRKICSASGENAVQCNTFVDEFATIPTSPKKIALSSFLKEDVGHDKETIWTDLNKKCLTALLGRCDIPQVCQTVMFDTTARSQFMLSHQLLHRVFAEMRQDKCNIPKNLVDQQVNDRLCGQMLQENYLIKDLLSEEQMFMDLFAENVALCGLVGYQEFFRASWIETILSWQNKEAPGCFQVSELMDKSQFACDSHLTSLSLSALANTWNYMKNTCK